MESKAANKITNARRKARRVSLGIEMLAMTVRKKSGTGKLIDSLGDEIYALLKDLESALIELERPIRKALQEKEKDVTWDGQSDESD